MDNCVIELKLNTRYKLRILKHAHHLHSYDEVIQKLLEQTPKILNPAPTETNPSEVKIIPNDLVNK